MTGDMQRSGSEYWDRIHLGENSRNLALEQRIWLIAFQRQEHLESSKVNIDVVALSEVVHYLEVIRRSCASYVSLNELYLDVQDRLTASLPKGSGPLSAEATAILEESQVAQFELRAEFETFYIFARVLLDKITQAVCRIFGAGKGEQTSHRRFTETINTYLARYEPTRCTSVLPGSYAGIREDHYRYP